MAMPHFAVALILIATGAVIADEPREWSDSTGKFHVEASLADFQNGIAYLSKSDGSLAHVPITRLSEQDQQFLAATVPAVKLIEGRVIGITDGDTMTVLDADKNHLKIRLEGIDAPERHQAYGTKSREALAHKAFGKSVKVEWREKDKYGRILGHVFVDDRWINIEMVQDGWAWHYREYSTSPVLADAESEARTKHAGLWNDEHPIAPWDFRQSKPQDTVLLRATDDSVTPKKLTAKSSKSTSIPRPVESPNDSSTVDRNPNGETVTGHTATGIPTFTGPRGGQYHYSKSGKKVYEKKK